MRTALAHIHTQCLISILQLVSHYRWVWYAVTNRHCVSDFSRNNCAVDDKPRPQLSQTSNSSLNCTEGFVYNANSIFQWQVLQHSSNCYAIWLGFESGVSLFETGFFFSKILNPPRLLALLIFIKCISFCMFFYRMYIR